MALATPLLPKAMEDMPATALGTDTAAAGTPAAAIHTATAASAATEATAKQAMPVMVDTEVTLSRQQPATATEPRPSSHKKTPRHRCSSSQLMDAVSNTNVVDIERGKSEAVLRRSSPAARDQRRRRA